MIFKCEIYLAILGEQILRRDYIKLLSHLCPDHPKISKAKKFNIICDNCVWTNSVFSHTVPSAFNKICI